MVASPEIEAVAVVVRVPSHYQPTKAALEAGKHVYCEWPLGRTTAEAVELAALAEARGLVTAVGLQARVNPAVMHLKELLEAGFVGEVMAVHVSLLRDGVLTRPPHRTWQRDAELGANTLTIANGHTVDAMRFVTGDFSRLSAVVATQAKQWLDTGTNTLLDVTSPDNVLVSGRLVNGAVASVHIGAIPFAGSGYRMEIYGRAGTLVATGEDSPQLSAVSLHGAKGGNTLAPMPVPERFKFVASATPPGEATNVGQMYTLFSRAIRGSQNTPPTFETAVDLHVWWMPSRRRRIPGREVSSNNGPASPCPWPQVGDGYHRTAEPTRARPLGGGRQGCLAHPGACGPLPDRPLGSHAPARLAVARQNPQDRPALTDEPDSIP